MAGAGRYVQTKAIRDAVAGRETEVLSALGIQWNGQSGHIRCPYPDHKDEHPSWRWNPVKRKAQCTCTRSSSIFDVVCKVKGINFEAAKIWIAETIGRSDLIVEANGQYQRTDAASLLSAPTDNRDDTLVWSYLAHRLGIEPDQVPRPATKVVGIKSLGYFDPPQRKDGKPVHVADFPAAVFETVDCHGKKHAHRIYLAPGGAGKAELGFGPNGQRREPKKSARKTVNESTAGRAVIWGDASKAETELIFEGIETAAAAAIAFQNEINSRKVAIFACISAGGVEAFRPSPATKRVIVGTDRDEASENGRAPSRRGEIAAQRFAALHHPEIAISIALPGKAGDDIDWLDVLQRDGVEAVRSGILSADPYSPSSGPAANGAADDAEVARLARLPPIAYAYVVPRQKCLQA
jgi:hypothetical protein